MTLLQLGFEAHDLHGVARFLCVRVLAVQVRNAMTRCDCEHSRSEFCWENLAHSSLGFAQIL